MVPVIVDGVSASFRAHNLWEAPDSEQWLAQHGASVRGIAASGRIDGALMAQLPNLEIVANFGVGYDGIDVEWAARHGVIVTNTPDVLTDEVADLAVGLLIATVRQLPQADRFLRAGSWLQSSFPLGPTLRTRTVGILGLGRIGRAIATRLEAFGLPIAYHGRTRQADVVYPYHDTLVGLAAAVDTLICVAPGGAATHHAVNAEVLAALGPSGVLINVGRGSVVDEAALIDALSRGVILSAGLDVFEDEPSVPEALIAMPHVVLLPHVGSASHHTRGLMGQLVVDNLLSWFSGKGPLSPVAETPWPANT
jgi:lactate dehydrogenase-like 2-hydroxyacid dehydrogenase